MNASQIVPPFKSPVITKPAPAAPVWRERIARALAAAAGLRVLFHTKVANPLSGRLCRVIEAITAAGDEWDEEALPAFKIEFADGTQAEAFFEELFSWDARFFALATATIGPFALSHQLGFEGPDDLYVNGSREQVAAFEAGLLTFRVTSSPVADHTPEAFRPESAFAVDAAQFHPLRGHVSDGVRVRFLDGRVLCVTSTLRGWVLCNSKGEQVCEPTSSAYELTSIIVELDGQTA